MVTVLILVLVLAIIANVASFFGGAIVGFRVLSNLTSKKMDELGIPKEQQIIVLKFFAEDYKHKKD